jgi:hypothetical protein
MHISVGAFDSTKVTLCQYIQSIDPPWLQRIMLQVATMKIEDCCATVMSLRPTHLLAEL